MCVAFTQFHHLLLIICVFQVPPTRMNLGTFKGKKVAAQKGFDLLKSKADALKVSTDWLIYLTT